MWTLTNAQIILVNQARFAKTNLAAFHVNVLAELPEIHTDLVVLNQNYQAAAQTQILVQQVSNALSMNPVKMSAFACKATPAILTPENVVMLMNVRKFAINQHAVLMLSAKIYRGVMTVNALQALMEIHFWSA